MKNVMDELLEVIEATDYKSRGYRCFTRKLVFAAIQEELLEDILEKLFSVLVSSDVAEVPATAMARRLTTRMANGLGVDLVGTKGIIKTGIEILDWFAKVGVVKAIKREQIEEKGNKLVKKESWFIEILVETEGTERDIYCDPRKPFRPWTTPTRFENGILVPLVKRADQVNMLHHYTLEQIPLMYKAINRLGSTAWEINGDLLAYANTIDETNSPLGALATPESLSAAYRALGNEKASKSRRKAAAKTIGLHEKRSVFNTIHDLAIEYLGHELHFTHNFCGRGRQYALAPHLSPQGADIAKALLVLKDKVPLVETDFWIHLANCAGEDKLTFDDRVKWVDDNIETLRAIGVDPVGNYDLIECLGVHREKKTYYQFIACCQDLAKYLAYDGVFLTGIMLGLDSTSSGNQILAMIAKDDEVAEYVNISATPDGKPGDLYRYVGKFVQQGLKALTLDSIPLKLQQYANLDAISDLANLPEGHKGFRKITKRICMVLPYSGTRYGSGEITKTDQMDHGISEMEALNFADCSVVGGLIYDKCVESAKKSMGILAYLRDGVDFAEQGPMLSWVIPQTNFRAFQVKEKTYEETITGVIGGESLGLKVHIPTGEPNKAGHKNSIAPGIVHSLDAAMLTMIVNGIPEELPVAAIHDQFCVPMGHMTELVNSARDAYASVACRDNFETLCESAFNVKRPLPPAGRWDVSELATTDYFIC